MKRYKFKIENITEKEIEIEAENNKNAVKKLAGFMAKKEENCAEILEKDKYSYINLKEISEYKNKILFDENDEINRDIICNLFTADEFELDEDKNEKDRDNLEEHVEVICERCGNCILLDDILHQLQS